MVRMGRFVGNMVGRNSQDGVHRQPLGRGPSPSANTPRVCPMGTTDHLSAL